MDHRDELPNAGDEPEADEYVSHAGSANDENEAPSEDEDGEDLLGDDMAADYRAMPHLDQYENEGIDGDFEDDADLEERMRAKRAADAYLDQREKKRRLPGALEDEEIDVAPSRRRAEEAQLGTGYDDGAEEVYVDWQTPKGRLHEWVQQDRVKKGLASCFKKFLCSYRDERGEEVYIQQMQHMVSANKQSLEVDYLHLSRHSTTLALWVVDVPKTVLEVFDDVALELVEEEFPHYHQIASRTFVRLTNIPVVDQLRDVRKLHLGSIIKVQGVVTRRTQVYPQLLMVMFDCMRCGNKIGPFLQSTEAEVTPKMCPACQSKGPFQLSVSDTVYRNYQKLTLQESPGTVPAGRLPRSKEVILLNDLIDCARPGDEVEITGIYSHAFDRALNAKTGFPVYSTMIEANHVSRNEDKYSVYHLTDEDRTQILQLSRDPLIAKRIFASIAPSIYGHSNIKTAIALAMFGGQEKHVGQHRLRGDINILLLGDPGTAKSQFLKYVEKTANRAVFTTGKGASAVGLTAAVHKDAVTREWTLEGGALVLADRGVCLIDEFDKMNDQDRTSIHEAMEQQSISLSKAGIVTTLQARCSIIAAANPIGGRYDSSRTFSENVELSDPIISRFDVMCVVKDTVDPVGDDRLAQFVIGSHRRSHPDAAHDELAASAEAASGAAGGSAQVIPQHLLRKYITYAKQNCAPKLGAADTDKLVAMYTQLRREGAVTHAMPVAVRHLESMVRMSEAHAMLHLRDHVTTLDVDVAIRVMLETFVSTQKFSVQKQLRRKFSRYLSQHRDYSELLLHLLRALLREQLRADLLHRGGSELEGGIRISCQAMAEKAQAYGLGYALEEFYTSHAFSEHGFEVDAARSFIVHAR